MKRWHLVDPGPQMVDIDDVPHLATMCGLVAPATECWPPDPDNPIPETSELVCIACQGAEVDDLLTPHKT